MGYHRKLYRDRKHRRNDNYSPRKKRLITYWDQGLPVETLKRHRHKIYNTTRLWYLGNNIKEFKHVIFSKEKTNG